MSDAVSTGGRQIVWNSVVLRIFFAFASSCNPQMLQFYVLEYLVMVESKKKVSTASDLFIFSYSWNCWSVCILP